MSKIEKEFITNKLKPLSGKEKKMKMIIAIMMLLMTVINVEAGEVFSKVSMFNEYRQSIGYLPTAILFTSGKVSEKVSLFGFASANKFFGEAYAGSMVSILPGIDLGGGAGISSLSGGLVISPQIIVAKGNFFWLTLGEFEKGSQFYLSDLTYKVSDSVKVGGFLKRFSGVGPQVSVTIPSTPVQVMAAPLYDFENKSFTGFTSVSLML